jgi:hypothetical protein
VVGEDKGKRAADDRDAGCMTNPEDDDLIAFVRAFARADARRDHASNLQSIENNPKDFDDVESAPDAVETHDRMDERI